ncbi:hypothetical protein ACFX2A_025369 [Malus domestica]
MAITKSATSVEDSNDIDTTSIDSATLKGVENPIILQGRSGGLCIWLKDGTTIKILSANNFVIDTCIQEKSATTSIHISWFYGLPHNHQKSYFWDTSLSDLGLPWVSTVDFNELLWRMRKRRWKGLGLWL